MFSSRSRNYSLKTFYNPKTQKKQPQEVMQKMRAPGLLPTIAQNRQSQKMQAKQLGININRFEHLATRDSSQVNNEEVVRNIYFIIKNFGEVQSNFKHLFANLHVKLKDFLFVHDSQIFQKYKIREGCSNKKAVKMMDKFHETVIRNKDSRITTLEQEIEKKQQAYRETLEQRQVQIFTLKQEVQKYKKMANIEYVRSLETKIQSLKELVSSQEQQYKVLAKKNEQLSLQLESVRRQLQEQESKCVRYESKIYDLNVIKQKTQIYLLKFKDRFDQLAGRLESFKFIIQKVQQENETLVSQRAKLVNRAAVTFQDLTPRPKYGNYFKFDNKTNLVSTQQIVQKLMGQIGEKQVFFEKNCVSQKNRKLMECEAIREKTFQQITKAKVQLKQLLI